MWEAQKMEALIKEEHAKIAAYEAAFQQIKEATGVSDVNEVRRRRHAHARGGTARDGAGRRARGARGTSPSDGVDAARATAHHPHRPRRPRRPHRTPRVRAPRPTTRR